MTHLLHALSLRLLVASAGECPQDGFLESLGEPLGPFEGRVQQAFVQKLEHLLTIVHEVLTREHICYWLDQGTLLSMWRHGAPVMRYDTDVDIGIDAADVPNVLKALSAHSELSVVDWVERHAVDHIEVTLWKAPHARMDVYFFHRRSVGSGFEWWSSADFLEPAGDEVLLPLKWMVWGALRFPVPRDPFAWLVKTEPDVYHPADLHIPDKNFEWRTGRYVRREEKPFQSFPLLSIVAWIPSATWAETFAEAMRAQDYPLTRIEVVAIGAMVPSSLGVSRAVNLLEWHTNDIKSLSGVVACFWDAQVAYGPYRITAQVAPILAMDGIDVSALLDPSGPAASSACWRPGHGPGFDGLVLDHGDGAFWSHGVGRRRLDSPETPEDMPFPVHISQAALVANARWTYSSARAEL